MGCAARQVERLAENARNHCVEYIPPDDNRHGIVHVIGPELGFTLPGATLVCGDSHTCTHGAFGCLAFGIGASECANVFSTQTLRQRRQKTMQVQLNGVLPNGVTVKDIVLSLISEIGSDGGVGHAIEFAGTTISHLSMPARMTLCNMAIEAGSRVGMVAVDDTTVDYLKGRPFAPNDDEWDQAVQHWRTLVSDADAKFDSHVSIDVSALEPQISWGTSPGTERAPFPDQFPILTKSRTLSVVAGSRKACNIWV